MKCLIPVIMSGIIAVYSLVIAVLIAGDMQPPSVQNYSLFKYVYHHITLHPPFTTRDGAKRDERQWLERRGREEEDDGR